MSRIKISTCILFITASNLWIIALPALAVQDYQPKTTDPISESWHWHSITELNGKGYRCMAEAADKSMWFGVDEGVMRYDGINWTIFTSEGGLGGAPVTALWAAKDSSIYAGTSKDVRRFKNGKWDRIFPLRGELNYTIYAIYQTSDESFWFGTDIGAFRIRDDQVMLYTVNMSEGNSLKTMIPGLKLINLSSLVKSFKVDRFYQDKQGALWFGLWKSIVARHDINTAQPDAPSAWQIFIVEDQIEIGNRSNFLQLSDSSIWCISNFSRKGVGVYKDNKWSGFSLKEHGGTDINTSIIQTPDGAIWIGGQRMLHVFKNGKWRVYQAPLSPIPAARLDLLYTSDGSVWIAGWMSDVVKLDYLTHRWTTYLDLNYECETLDKTQWFIEWDSGVVSYQPGTSEWKKYTVEDGLIDTPVRLIATRKGELVAAGSHRQVTSVAHFNGQSWIRHSLEEMGWGVTDRAVFESSDGSLWFGGDSPTIGTAPRGVMRYHPSKGSIDNEDAWTFYQHPLMNEVVISFGETGDGRIWNGDIVLSAFDGVTNTPITHPEALTKVRIECMFTTPDFHLWIGTRGQGVFNFDGECWKQQTVQDGLLSNIISSILVDSKNSVWVGTMNGISRFDGNTWITKALPDAIYVEPQNGSIQQSLDGAIWISNRYREWSSRGYYSSPILKKPGLHFQTTRYQPDTQLPITRITLYEKKVSQPGNTVIEWEGRDAWGDTPEDQLQFSYRMDNGEWSYYSRTNHNTFLSLSTGNHIFQVRARDKDFNVDPSPVSVRFTVIPPVYQQAWFIGMILIFITALGFYQYSIVQRDKRLIKSNKSLKERTNDLQMVNIELEQQKQQLQIHTEALNKSNQELEQFAYVASHDLQEPLRMVNSYITLLQKRYKNNLSAEAGEFINYALDGTYRMKNLIRDLLDYSRITTEAKPLESIHAMDILQAALDNLQITVEETRAEVTHSLLPAIMADRHQLIRLFQNLIGNAIKYNQNQPKIHISAENRDNQWLFAFKDNGIGIDLKFGDRIFGIFQRLHGRDEYTGTGIGLAVCKKIVERHGGKIWVESKGDGKGSVFYFTIPNVQKIWDDSIL